jgi:hypothetical protein
MVLVHRFMINQYADSVFIRVLKILVGVALFWYCIPHSGTRVISGILNKDISAIIEVISFHIALFIGLLVESIIT